MRENLTENIEKEKFTHVHRFKKTGKNDVSHIHINCFLIFSLKLARNVWYKYPRLSISFKEDDFAVFYFFNASRKNLEKLFSELP